MLRISIQEARMLKILIKNAIIKLIKQKEREYINFSITIIRSIFLQFSSFLMYS